MRIVSLLHNPKAGNESHDKKKLREAIESAGFECRYLSTKKNGWKDFDEQVDFIVVAGGDGTVSKVAEELLKRNGKKIIPIAILPLGTANNIAKSLHISGETEKII